MKSRLVIGSRGSLLARTQSEWIAARLRNIHPGLDVVIEIISTKGDRILDTPLAQIGDKGLFTLELETALLDGGIDLAVHSLKDLPTSLPDGLALGAVPEREIPHDALVAPKWPSLDALPAGAKVGTSSLRRAAQLRAYRPDLDVVNLRGNIDTRIAKVHDGVVDAAILACAGIHRLGRREEIAQIIDPAVMIPAVSQGALGLEVRAGDGETAAVLAPLQHAATAAAVTAERRVLAVLEGGCQVPLGAHARVHGGALSLIACVCSLDGAEVIRCAVDGSAADPVVAGDEAARLLLDQGAGRIIAGIR